LEIGVYLDEVNVPLAAGLLVLELDPLVFLAVVFFLIAMAYVFVYHTNIINIEFFRLITGFIRKGEMPAICNEKELRIVPLD
jgi:hypothetical protein